ncbi:MAG: cytosine/creatinine deaminase, partial [Gaiellaceae bacterium]|nr:cytosine/creatinine deaminase [Gaiellaceae bacterium]
MRAALVVRNARLMDGRLVDLLAQEGRWTRIGENVVADGAEELDAEGRLVTPPLVDCHLHLDASLTAGTPRWNESGTLIEGIHVWGELKPSLTEQDVFDRAHEIVRWSVAQGTMFIRAHADVSGENEAMVRGLLRLRHEVADLCTIQVTAFPQDGIYARDGDEERLENALRLGVDCVGGIPHFEPTAELGLKEVHRVFELARQYSRRIDVHCDETDDPASRFLEVMADDTVKFGLAGRVTASHCTAMGSYEPYYSSKLRGFLRRAGINIVVNPYANSLIQGRLDPYPKRRGFAQLK